MKKLIFNKKVQIIFVVALTFAIVMYLFVPKNLPCKNTNPLVQTTENTLSSDQGSLFNQYSQLTNLTGEDYEEYQLQKQFAFDMSWSNVLNGEIHIDHIIPLDSAKIEEDIYRLCHYTNLQPLWAEDNLSKGCKLNWAKN